MKTYKQFNITATPFNPDVLSGLLWQLDITGISEDEDSLSIFADEESNISVIQISDILNPLKEQNLVETFASTRTLPEGVSTNRQLSAWGTRWRSSSSSSTRRSHISRGTGPRMVPASVVKTPAWMSAMVVPPPRSARQSAPASMSMCRG